MPIELSPNNEREFHRLLVSIQASANRLDLFVAICDDRNVQEAIIERYEAALQKQRITPYQVRLSQKRPSLRASLEKLMAQNPTLRSQEKAVVTVLGGNELLGVRLTEEKSEQEKFFFSLQWTREALREFRFPIVVWLSDAVATGVSQQAQDFWSWRSGVFEFEGNMLTLPSLAFFPEKHPIQQQSNSSAIKASDITELIQQITEIQQQNPQSPLLVTLYTDLGNAYRQAYAQELALRAYNQAINLAKTLEDKSGQAKALGNAGVVLCNSGRYGQAITFLQQALEIQREIGDQNDEAKSLQNLGFAHCALGQYERAIVLYQQSLKIQREIGDRNGEAASLNSLGSVYKSLGQYERAIDFYQQSLAIDDHNSEANALNNLGNVYRSLGQYERAIDFYQRSLEIDREMGNYNSEADTLNNLGNVYASLGQSDRMLALYQQSLAIFREIGDRDGEAKALGNLGNAYNLLSQEERAINFLQRSLEVFREIGDRNSEAIALMGLGNSYASLWQYEQAIDLYKQSLEIQRDVGIRDSEGLSLFNLGCALENLDRHYEAAESYQQALAIYKELKLDHMVEECEKAIARRT
jgi:tetratricopeptide (TPR) repeat protein